MRKALFILVIVCILFLFAAATADRGGIPSKLPGLKSQANLHPSGIHVDFGSIPLYFTANRGQVDGRALFYAKAARYTLWLTEAGLVFDSSKPEKTVPTTNGDEHSIQPGKITARKFQREVSRLVFLNASRHPQVVAVDETELKVNYFIGNDPKQWHTSVPTSKAVLYKNIYKNIDLKVYGNENLIEYDWIVRPGGDPRNIRFRYENVKGTRLDKEGNLLVATRFGELMHKKPVAYQQGGGSGNSSHATVESTFKKIGKNAYGFAVGAYDADRELVIDPVVLAYSSYLGGSNTDAGYGIAADDSGNVYLTGTAFGTNFPTLNQYQTDQPNEDVFVTKIDTTQSGNASLVYSTYLGGSSWDEGHGIAVDNSGKVYVTGYTYSTNFPTLNQFQAYQAGYDAFVTKLDTTQSGAASLVYSTCVGGDDDDFSLGIAVDNSGNAYVAGYTYSANFPTLNQYQTYQAAQDAFVTKIDTTKSGNASLVYSTCLGGSSDEIGFGIARDNSGNVYATGFTSSTNFPTLNQYQTDQAGTDVFLSKIDTTQSGVASLVYSTYLGGNDADEGHGIAVDNSGNAYVAGYTYSTDFPTVNQFQAYQADYDTFVTKIDTTQSGNASLVYSTYLGGDDDDEGYGIAVDNNGNVYVTGQTASTNFPTLNQYQTDQGGNDVFVTKLDTTRSGTASLVYSTYLGGNGHDFGWGIAIDNSGNVYVTGQIASTNFPCLNQYQTFQAGWDAFITKVSFNAEIAVTKTSNNLSPKVGENFNFTITATNNGPCAATGVQVADPLPAGLAYVSATASTGTYTLSTGIWDIGNLANGATTTLTLTVQGTAGGDVTNTASVSALNEYDPVSANNSASVTVNIKCTLTIIAGAGGTTNPVPGTYTYDEGTEVNIQTIASAGYRFGNWSGDASGSVNPVSITMDGSKTVTANFIRQYTLTIAAGAGGTTNPVPGTYPYDEGTAVNIQALASAGYRFGNWSGDASGSVNPVSITMDGNKTVTANFIRQYTLTIAAGTGGTTNPRPGIYAYDQGTSVSLRATAATGFSFGNWSGNASGSANSITITMNANKKVTANFIRGYTLTITAGAGGTTNPMPGTYTYNEGTAVILQALPFAAYQLDTWSGDASGSANPVTVVMNGNKAIQANFTRVVKVPLGLTGEKLLNRNVSMAEYIARLRWQPNSANTGTISYRIYQIANGQATAIANVGAGTYEYIVHGLLATNAYFFGVTAVNSQGWESDMVQVAVQ